MEKRKVNVITILRRKIRITQSRQIKIYLWKLFRKKHFRRQKETMKIWSIVKYVNTNVKKKVHLGNMLTLSTTSIKSVMNVEDV